MNIILVGGAGYIGRHLARHFSELGHRIQIIDLQKGRDVRGYQGALLGADVLVHLAHLKSVRASLEDPFLYYKHNLEVTLAVVNLVRAWKIPHVVFSSSATVYAPSEKPLSETSPVGPTTPYGQTKLMSEQILLDTCPSVCVLRYFNPVFGVPGLEEYQEFPENLEPSIRKALVSGATLKVFGTDYNTDDGTAVRDYIDVERLSAAHAYALTHRGKDVVNIGTGSGMTVLQFVRAFESRYEVTVPLEFKRRRAGDLERLVACTRKSKSLGWDY